MEPETRFEPATSNLGKRHSRIVYDGRRDSWREQPIAPAIGHAVRIRPSGRAILMWPVRGNWQSHMASAEIAAKYNLHSLLRGMACLVCGVVNEGTQSAKTASSGRCPMPLHYSASSPRLIIRASSISAWWRHLPSQSVL